MPSTHTLLSAILLTTTLASAQNLGDPGNLNSYPRCAQLCQVSLEATGYDIPGNLTSICSPRYRGVTAACEGVLCTDAEFNVTQTLAAQGCDIVYQKDRAYGTAVAAAVASASSLAAAEKGLDPSVRASYPECAQDCQTQAFAASSVKSLSDSRVCTDTTVNSVGSNCLRAECGEGDLFTTVALTFRLCQAAVNNFTVNTTKAEQTPVTINGTGPPLNAVPFTGVAGARGVGMGVVGVIAFVAGLVVL